MFHDNTFAPVNTEHCINSSLNSNYHEVFPGKSSGIDDTVFQAGIGICGIQCLNGCTSITTESNQHHTYAELSEHNR